MITPKSAKPKLLTAVLVGCLMLPCIASGQIPANTQSTGKQIPPETTAGKKAENLYFNSAYHEIADMLDGKQELSVKRTVFLLEWAYLGGKLDYDEYCKGIDSTVCHLNLFIKANNLGQFKTGGNYALFEYFCRPYSMNGHKPFTYDYEDFAGHKDFTKVFVTKLMRTHTGQCRSLPLYYKILAEAIGAEAYITHAPQHLFVRHHDEQDPAKWVNVELTQHGLSRDAHYIESFGITDEAIRNKVYLYPMDTKETIAFLITELGSFYQKTYDETTDCDGFIMACAEKSLQHYPDNFHGLVLKHDALRGIALDYVYKNGNKDDSKAAYNRARWLEVKEKIYSMGHVEMSNETYEGLIRGVEQSMERDGFDPSDVRPQVDEMRKPNEQIYQPTKK